MRYFRFLLAIAGVLNCSCKNEHSYIQLSNNITQVELDDIISLDILNEILKHMRR